MPAVAMTVPALVAEDAVSRMEVRHRAADFQNLSRKLVAQDLWFGGQGNWLMSRVQVIVRVALEKVKVGSAHPYRAHPDQYLARAEGRIRHRAHRHRRNIFENRSFHKSSEE